MLQTLKEEQEHTQLYIQRMSECGIQFGALPLSGYFWRAVSKMENPMDYVAGLSLTFEQANLERFAARVEYEHFNIRDADNVQLYSLGVSYTIL